MGERFPYAARARAVVEALAAVRSPEPAITDPGDRTHPSMMARRSAAEAFHAAIAVAYPNELRDALCAISTGDPVRIDVLIEFLEADPIFFRSGYQKERILQYLKRARLTAVQSERLQAVVTQVVMDRDCREFRRYCRLAPHIDAPAFREGLRVIATGPDKGPGRRARWVLEAHDRADTQARGVERRATRPTP